MDELIVGKDKVRTANGFKLIKEIFNDTYDSYYEIHFDDGTTVKVTEDHPVILHNGHLKSIDGNLRNYSYQFISKMKIGDEFYNKKITDLIRIPGNDLTYLPIVEDWNIIVNDIPWLICKYFYWNILKDSLSGINSGWDFKGKRKINVSTVLMDIVHSKKLNKVLEIVRKIIWRNSVKSLN